MATIIDPIPGEPLGPQIVYPTNKRPAIASPIGWSSIFAAAVVSAGVWLVLHLMGVGIGLTAIEPDNAGSLRGVGIGTGVWSLLAPLIALFIGGLVAGRTAPTLNTWNAIIHATAAWALAALGALLLIAMMIGAAMRTAASTAGAAVNVAGMVGQKADDISGALGIDSKDIVAGLNTKLAKRGMPPVSAEDVQTVAKEAAGRVVRGDTVDREALIDIAAKRTALSRPQAETLATELEGQMTQLRQKGSAALEQGKQTALQAAETTGKVLFGLSLTMLLGLAAAMAGAVISVRRERRDHARGRVPATRIETP